MLIGWGAGVGVGVAVGVWVAVGVALAVGVLEGVSVAGGLVASTVSFPVTGSSCGSSVGDPEQAHVRATRIRNDNHKARGLRIIRMLDTCKGCSYEI
jgi:hypothetical protein